MYDIQNALRRRAMAERLEALRRANDDTAARAQVSADSALGSPVAPAAAPAPTVDPAPTATPASSPAAEVTSRPRHRNETPAERRRHPGRPAPRSDALVDSSSNAMNDALTAPLPTTSDAFLSEFEPIEGDSSGRPDVFSPLADDLSLGRPPSSEVFRTEPVIDNTSRPPSPRGRDGDGQQARADGTGWPGPVEWARGDQAVAVLNAELPVPRPSLPSSAPEASADPVQAMPPAAAADLAAQPPVQPKPASEDEPSTSSAATIADMLRRGASPLFFGTPNPPKGSSRG
jgi:hypothetical protein